MAVTAWKYAQIGAAVSGQTAADNPSSVTASDIFYATFSNPDGSTLRARSFGFTSADIPTGAKILGVEIGLERYALSDDFTNDRLVQLSMHSAGTAADRIGSNQSTSAHWPYSETENVFGGSTDMLGATLTQAQAVSAAFGLDFAAASFTTGYLNAVRARFYYDPVTINEGAGTASATAGSTGAGVSTVSAAGTGSAVASSFGDIVAIAEMAGTAEAVALAVAPAAIIATTVGTAAGSGLGGSDASGAQPFYGQAQGFGAAVATTATLRLATGGATAVSSASGAGVSIRSIAGSAAAVSAGAGNGAQTRLAGGAATGVASGLGRLGILRSAAGTTVAASSAQGISATVRASAGNAVALAAASGNVVGAVNLPTPASRNFTLYIPGTRAFILYAPGKRSIGA